MPTGDPGINKPYDRILKSFSDEDPVLLLRLLGFIPAGAEADIEPLHPESAPAMVMPDFVAVGRTAGGERVIFHAEFQSRYHQNVPRNMARYGGSLGWQHLVPVESALVLLNPEGVPSDVPTVGHYDIGSTQTTHPYRLVRLWELDPAPVLATNNPRLLPWILLMNSSEQQVRQVASIVRKSGDEEAKARFKILGRVRYDVSTVDEMLGGETVSLQDAVLELYCEATGLFKKAEAKALAKGEEEGRARGQAEGRIEGERKLLRIGLRAKFPTLENLPEIDSISSLDKLEFLMETLFHATDAQAMHDAILAAVEPN